jgi:hypothetical protein
MDNNLSEYLKLLVVADVIVICDQFINTYPT